MLDSLKKLWHRLVMLEKMSVFVRQKSWCDFIDEKFVLCMKLEIMARSRQTMTLFAQNLDTI